MNDKEKRPLNKPWRTPGKAKKYAVVVKDPKSGKRKMVRFGDPKMDDYRKHKDEGRRKNFKSRHNCSDKKDKTKPGWWSCNWSW